MRRFLTELRRRNVPRVAAAYALSAGIIIEAGSVLLPTFGASERLFQAYVVAVIAGFVVAVVWSWMFEWTPEGVRLDRTTDVSAARQPRSHQRMNLAIIALLVVALAVSVTFNVRDVEREPPRSIAGLPFTSLSTNPDNVLFADGIHDDLLTKLANISALKVISRTSVMNYRDTGKNLRQIGEELGVETVLEGSVQRIGDSVRVNMQPIDADTDRHLWADTYERERGLLKSTLWSQAMTGRENVEAEQAFRRAIALNPSHASAWMWFASLRSSEERLDEAIELYQRSIELDPLARIPYSNLPQIYAKSWMLTPKATWSTRQCPASSGCSKRIFRERPTGSPRSSKRRSCRASSSMRWCPIRRFASMIDELDAYLAVMRDRLLEAEASDDLDSLRAMVTRT